jgi:hypothetical protein
MWRSLYDGVLKLGPSGFDIEDLVPLNEVWQSGAWRCSSATRAVLRERPRLLGVTGRGHRMREPGQERPRATEPDAGAAVPMRARKPLGGPEVALAVGRGPGREALARQRAESMRLAGVTRRRDR